MAGTYFVIGHFYDCINSFIVVVSKLLSHPEVFDLDGLYFSKSLFLRLADVSVLGTLTGVGFELITIVAIVFAESNGFPDARTEYNSSIFLFLHLPA